MAYRWAALGFALLAACLFSAMSLWAPQSVVTDPQQVIGGYGPDHVANFFAGLTGEAQANWRWLVLTLDLPFILSAGAATILALIPGHGIVRVAGLSLAVVFILSDLAEDMILLDYLAAGFSAMPFGGAVFLGWLTTVKFVAFAGMVLGALVAIWQ